MYNSAEYPAMVEKTKTGWKVTAFRLPERFTCEGACYYETLARARQGLMEMRAQNRLNAMGLQWIDIEILTDGSSQDP
jgi:hypothetical protein